MSKGRDIHGQVEHLRESGNFLDSLKLSEEVFLTYQAEGDSFGMGDVLASRSITLRLLSEDTGDLSFLIWAKHEAMAGVEITRTSPVKSEVFMPLFRLGQVQEELGELSEAANSYKEAISTFQTNPPKEHNRSSVLNDMQIRYFICEYKKGDKTALVDAERALSDIEADTTEPKYTKDVWCSGGHMRIAEAIKTDNLEKAKEHLQKAKEIIDANPELKIRKKQFEKISRFVLDELQK